ncbi:MAG: PC4/YdbC family ssDNA-binding protein [Eubacteriales bacterium]|nr:PC4/YdbC family ssDNA-binding protein [Eubacteriales bacterium]
MNEKQILGETKPRRQVIYEIKEHIGVLSTSSSGWTREVNLVSWNDRPARIDIRDWDPERRKMSRGIGLNLWEVRKLIELMKDYDLESDAA